ncbi:MAG: carbon-nitrogen hydrolase family protein [Candidatus Nanoarchaeia archaeon]|nr:carbon-nitrogen hydrolase family protein [Candidatus Nanoarchaeia archaeon]MDD5357724.1 carbon-nitrogen hydrolase family protein [Candidatus Nanoarchaeia archaeon]MDD5588643.1 carbon-nitrogen hydrolase family protein [Candidatus Nanoarchaeia archaeon]
MKKKRRKNPIIALAQIKYYDINKNNNVEKIKKYIRLAKKKNADIICFPESVVTRTKTLHFDDKFVKEIKQECKENSIWCIITEDFILKGKPYNLTILIDRCGKIRGSYKKINLYGDSDGIYPGKRIKVLQTDFAKIGIAVCWDLAFADLFKKMKQHGAEIVFCPAFWCYEEKAYDKNHRKEETDLLRALIRTRAFENIYFVGLINPVTKRADRVSYSAIVSPQRILKEIINKEGLIISKIDLKEIKKIEKLYSDENIN